MTEKQYIEFLDQYADLLRVFETHFSSLRENWKEVTSRNCPFKFNKLEDAVADVRSAIVWEKTDLISASLVGTEVGNYFN
jgi:GTPase SAR1 family protein